MSLSYTGSYKYQSSYMYPESNWVWTEIGASVSATLYGLPAPLILILGVLSFIKVKRRGDPLRASFPILHSLWWIFIVFLGLHIIAVLATGFYSTDSGYPEDTGFWFSNFSQLLTMFAMALTTILLYSIGTGILEQHNGPRQWHAYAKWTATGVCVAYMVLALGLMGKGIAFLTSSNFDYDSYGLPAEMTIQILNWVLSLGLVGMGIYIIKQTKSNAETQKMVRIYMAAVSIWLVRSLFLMIVSIRFYQHNWKINTEFFSLAITKPIFDFWIQVIVTVLIFFIGKMKVGGLWSSEDEGQFPRKSSTQGEQVHMQPV